MRRRAGLSGGWSRSCTIASIFAWTRCQSSSTGVGIAIDGEKVTFVVVVAAKVSRTATVKR